MSRQGKILMLLDNPFRSDARPEKEANSLMQAGYEVSIWTEVSDQLPVEEDRGGLKIRRVLDPIFKHPLRKEYRKNVHAVAMSIVNAKVDAVHCHDYQMLPYGTAAKKIDPTLKLVYDSHEYLPGWPLHETSKGFLNRFKGYLTWKYALRKEGIGARLADAMIVVNEPFVSKYKKALRLSRPPIVVSNFPNSMSEQDLHSDQYFHHKYGLDQDMLVVVHTGNIYYSEEQVEALINTLSQFPELVLVFFGSLAKYKDLERRFAHLPNVYFDGFSSQAENVKRMAAADIGICHVVAHWESSRFTMANRYMEYTYAGLAIVCNEYSGARHITDRFPNTLYYSGMLDEGNFAAVLKDTITKKESLKKQSILARQHFSFEREAEKLINIYKQLIG
jgi:glycosyltransferase involved in cell wall biosynthesis